MDDLKNVSQAGAATVILFSKLLDHNATAVDDEDPRVRHAVPGMSRWVVRVEDAEGFDMGMVHV